MCHGRPHYSRIQKNDNPPYGRIAAEAGFDAIWLDLEHRWISDGQVQALLAYFHLCDIDCIIRPATLEKSRLSRYLEDGATGLMIPHVSNPELAMAIVRAVKSQSLNRLSRSDSVSADNTGHSEKNL